MPIYDQSYRRIEGTRKPGRFRFGPIAASGLRLFFRRRRHIFLGVAALAPFMIGLFIVSVPQFLPNLIDVFPPEVTRFFHVTSVGAYIFLVNPLANLFRFLFLLLAGSGLIANDLSANAVEMYFSRPITRTDYILGKFMVLMGILLLITTLPAVLLWLFDVSIATEPGFFVDQIPLLGKIVLASLVVTIPPAMVMLAISSLTKTGRAAMIVFGIAAVVMPAIAEKLSESLDQPKFELVDLGAATSRVAASILDVTTESLLRNDITIEVPVSQATTETAVWVVAGVTLLALAIVYRRIRPIEIVAG